MMVQLMVETRSSKITAPAHTIHIAVNPVPASRPRVTRWGTYYAKTYKTWMQDAATHLKAHHKDPEGGPLTGPLEVFIRFIIEKPRTSKREWPRGDVDNYAKAILDVITKETNVWHDDDQVVQLHSAKEFASSPDEVGTHVIIFQR